MMPHIVREGCMMRRLSLFVTGLVLFATPAMAQLQGPCFFIQPDYKGDPMCIAPTQKLPSLGPAAKNKLMSVQIPQGVRVTICDGDNFAGSVASETGAAPARATAQPPVQPPGAQQPATQPPAPSPGAAAVPARPQVG